MFSHLKNVDIPEDNGLKFRLTPTQDIPNPNEYVKLLCGEYRDYAFDENRVTAFKGRWRQQVFANNQPLDVEIGTGNGFHFAHYAEKNPHRNVVGLEVKFKPLIQAIRRALRAGAQNARIARFNASHLYQIFEKQEVDNLIIHHPDPWPKPRHWKHRLIQDEFLEQIYELQKPGGIVEFKTDSRDYFDWTMQKLRQSKYRILQSTTDLHNSALSDQNFQTHFENLFANKGVKINLVRFTKPQAES